MISHSLNKFVLFFRVPLLKILPFYLIPLKVVSIALLGFVQFLVFCLILFENLVTWSTVNIFTVSFSPFKIYCSLQGIILLIIYMNRRRATPWAKKQATPPTQEAIEEFTYLSSTISSNLSLDSKLNKQIRKAAMANWPAWQRGSGTTPSWPTTPRCRCTKPVWSYSVLQHQVMDFLFLPRTQVQYLSPMQPQENCNYPMSSPSTKQECPQPGRHPQHVCTPDPMLSAVAWPHPLWWAHHWFTVVQKGLSYITRTSANETWGQATLIRQDGSQWLKTTVTGEGLWRHASVGARRRDNSTGKGGESTEGRGQNPYSLSKSLLSPAATASEPADLESDCTATGHCNSTINWTMVQGSIVSQNRWMLYDIQILDCIQCMIKTFTNCSHCSVTFSQE